ncbi:MAG: 2-isopropylmalate synthase [Spirochaetes bacterium GWD1_27_9]|nr:MAG: 2-isopropylmalate synthase [Spirochaetes bacterium GWB1_27_13]OHD27266.1 MAG: 2-isopropylmalate synthase [Spirochaetes bacterium GWC1_27_15]OHD31375.1 MAG: 2-isopropylmalate synthase [Spirochaetes bacterium GWD1_27_9]
MDTNKIRIFDTTLRDGEQSPGAAMTAEQKLQIARALRDLGVDVIEAGFPISSKIQFDGVKEIADVLQKESNQKESPYIVALARCVEKDIDAAYDATKNNDKKAVHIFIATSPIHMEYKLKKTPEEVLATVKKMISYAKNKGFEHIEFSAEDASRSEFDFLVEVFRTAIDNGATTINVPDTVGYAIPHEYGELIGKLKKAIPEFNDKVYLSVHCHNDLGLANANAISAVVNGATQVEVTINGIGERAGNTALEEFVMSLDTRKDLINKTTNINKKLLYPTSKQLIHLTGLVPARNKPIIGENVFIHESGIHQDGMIKNRQTYEIINPEMIGRDSDTLVLGRHSGMNGFKTRLEKLGIKIEPKEKLEEAFQKFSELADTKKEVYDDDLFVILGDIVNDIPEGYSLKYHSIFSEKDFTSTEKVNQSARVELIKGNKKGNVYEAASSSGDGPVDAIFKAITKITKVEPVLKEYIVQAVSSGTDAQGEVKLSLEIKGEVYNGRGSSTDVIEASAKAYLNAINKHLFVKK